METISNELTPEKAKLHEEVEKTKEELLSQYDIENLTNIEAVRLRQIVEQCILEHARDEEEMQEKYRRWEAGGKKKDDPIILQMGQRGKIDFESVSKEAAARWLWELYGIEPNDIPRGTFLTDKTTGEVFKYIVPPQYHNRNIHALHHGPGDATFKEQWAFQDDMKAKIKQKREELVAQGHEVEFKSGVEMEFKDWIRIVREKAHLI